MRKLFYSMIAVIGLGCMFTACNSDDDDEVINYSTTADQATAGTYSGTWTRTLDGNTETFSGTITLESAGTAGATNVTFNCPEASLNAKSIANVWNAKHEFEFMNQTVGTANELGVAFSGRITQDGALTAAFTLSQRVGRKNYEFLYQFVGNK